MNVLELLRETRRAAGDMRKIFLALYGLLLLVPLAILILGACRAALPGHEGGLRASVVESFLWPVQSLRQFVTDALRDGHWGLLALALLLLWLAATLVGSFFGLAVTRMAAVELTCRRRADVGEAVRFARKHWSWAFLTPSGLAFGALGLLGLGVLLVSLGRQADLLVVLTAPLAFILVLGAVVLLLGLLAGGLFAWPAIATEWSDAFDAATRVYGYSFGHAYRVLLYRAGAGLAFALAVFMRAVRAVLVLGGFYLVLRVGLGAERTGQLLDAVLLEPPRGLPLPQTLAGWMLLTCVAIFLTLLVARLLVYRIVLRQAVYLVLRQHVDRVPLDNIDGYKPDDSDYDPTAQGFELVEVEEELRAE